LQRISSATQVASIAAYAQRLETLEKYISEMEAEISEKNTKIVEL